MSTADDNRIVVLLKSRRTNNRFYTLVDRALGYKNADAIADFPPNWVLGIAYPCLEDGLNDFAVIRTTFETIDVFPDDQELRIEMMAIIADARTNLVKRLEELRDGIVDGRAHFLGTILQEFKDRVVHMATKGTPRRTLDSMMKVDVFESVARAQGGAVLEPMYRYEFLPQNALSLIEPLPPRAFVGRLLDDVLAAVREDGNYTGKVSFDRFVFQKFIAVMFVNYATTDPVFYGTNRDDYGVSGEKDMSTTPLYQAVGLALRELEREAGLGPHAGADRPAEVAPGEAEDLSHIFDESGVPDFLDPVATTRTVDLPLNAERAFLEPLSLLADAARLLSHYDSPRAVEVRTMVTKAEQRLFRQLQELKILSPLAQDPLDGS
jgi:hypothetical protein